MTRRERGLVVLGRVHGLFGVAGWVKVYSHTRPPDAIFNYDPWLVGGDPYRVLDGRVQGKGLVARLDGIEDRDRAAALVGAEIAVPRERLPALPPGRHYWVDLEGLEVVDTEGRVLGRVDHLIETGANDVLVVEGERSRLIPYVDDVVKDVDLDRGRMTVDWDADF